MAQQMVTFPIVAPLPKFGDQVNQTLSDFVIDFENFLEQNYITSEELKIKTLISALTGAPRQQILRRMYGTNGQDGEKSYQNLLEGSKLVYGKGLTKQQAMLKINSMKKSPRQSWPAYTCLLYTSPSPRD